MLRVGRAPSVCHAAPVNHGMNAILYLRLTCPQQGHKITSCADLNRLRALNKYR